MSLNMHCYREIAFFLMQFTASPGKVTGHVHVVTTEVTGHCPPLSILLDSAC